MLKFKEDKMLYIFGIISLAFFGIFIKMNYSVDTYLLFASQNLEYVQEYIRSGRFFTAFLFKFFQFIRFTPEEMYVASFLIGIVCITFAIYILYNVFKKYINNNILNTLITIAIIINPFVIELWLFAEMGIMMLSILFCIIAYKNFDEYLENHQKNNIYFCIFFMLIAMFSYQGTTAIFIALSVISIIKHNVKFIQMVKNTIILLICYGIPILINFLLIMIIGNSRVGLDINFVKTINFILLSTKEQLLNGFNLYPIVLFKSLHIFSFAIVIIYIIVSKDNYKQKLKRILQFIYIVFMTYFFTIATIIPQNINSAVMFPRNSYAYGSIIGLIFLFAIICLKKGELEKNKLIIITVLILLIMEFIQFTFIGINRYIVNYMDKYIIHEIDEKIYNYEKTTGNKIESIAVYNLENSTLFYPDINDMINVSAKNEKMSGSAIIEFYMHRKLKNEQQSKEIYDKYFKDNNWNMFNLEQITFEGNTMHWYLY